MKLHYLHLVANDRSKGMDRTAVIYSASANVGGRTAGAFVLVDLAPDCGSSYGQEDFRGFLEVACVLPRTTVHRAELIAVRQALRAFDAPLEFPVDLVSSNKYIVDMLEPDSDHRPKANVDLIEELRGMNEDRPDLASYRIGALRYGTRWCRANSGDPGNDRARFIAERAAQSGKPWYRDKLRTEVWREGRGVVVDFPWNAEGPLPGSDKEADEWHARRVAFEALGPAEQQQALDEEDRLFKEDMDRLFAATGCKRL